MSAGRTSTSLITRLIELLDQGPLRSIEQAFKSSPAGKLDANEFVELISGALRGKSNWQLNSSSQTQPFRTDDIRTLFVQLDSDGDGFVSYGDFSGAVLASSLESEQQHLYHERPDVASFRLDTNCLLSVPSWKRLVVCTQMPDVLLFPLRESTMRALQPLKKHSAEEVPTQEITDFPGVLRMQGHRGGVLCAAFAAGPGRLATGAADATVILWNDKVLAPHMVFTVASPITCIRAHESEGRFFAGCTDGHIVTFAAGHHGIMSAAETKEDPARMSLEQLRTNWLLDRFGYLSLDPRVAVSDGRLWTNVNRRFKELESSTTERTGTSPLSPSEQAGRLAPPLLVNAPSSNPLRAMELWRRDTTFVGHSDWVTDVVCVAGLPIVVSCGLDRTLIVWDAQTGTTRTVKNASSEGALTLACDEVSRNILSAGFGTTITVWSALTAGGPVAVLRQHQRRVLRVLVVPYHARSVSVDVGGTICVWNLDNMSCVCILGMPLTPYSQGTFHEATVDPSGMIITANKQRLAFYRLRALAKEARYSLPSFAFQYNADFNLLVGGHGSKLTFVHPASGTLGLSLRPGAAEITSIRACSRYILVGLGDGSFSQVDFSGQILASLPYVLGTDPLVLVDVLFEPSVAQTASSHAPGQSSHAPASEMKNLLHVLPISFLRKSLASHLDGTRTDIAHVLLLVDILGHCGIVVVWKNQPPQLVCKFDIATGVEPIPHPATHGADQQPGHPLPAPSPGKGSSTVRLTHQLSAFSSMSWTLAVAYRDLRDIDNNPISKREMKVGACAQWGKLEVWTIDADTVAAPKAMLRWHNAPTALCFQNIDNLLLVSDSGGVVTGISVLSAVVPLFLLKLHEGFVPLRISSDTSSSLLFLSDESSITSCDLAILASIYRSTVESSEASQSVAPPPSTVAAAPTTSLVAAAAAAPSPVDGSAMCFLDRFYVEEGNAGGMNLFVRAFDITRKCRVGLKLSKDDDEFNTESRVLERVKSSDYVVRMIACYPRSRKPCSHHAKLPNNHPDVIFADYNVIVLTLGDASCDIISKAMEKERNAAGVAAASIFRHSHTLCRSNDQEGLVNTWAVKTVQGTLPFAIKNLIIALLLGTLDLHSGGFLHTDIKVRNVVAKFDFANSDGDFFLIDLDGATAIGETLELRYTPHYCPPEMAQYLRHGKPVIAMPSYDAWSVGVCICELVYGRGVFSSKDSDDFIFDTLSNPEKLEKQLEDLPYGQFDLVDTLISGFLHPNPKRRLRISDAATLIHIDGWIEASLERKNAKVAPPARHHFPRHVPANAATICVHASDIFDAVKIHHSHNAVADDTALPALPSPSSGKNEKTKAPSRNVSYRADKGTPGLDRTGNGYRNVFNVNEAFPTVNRRASIAAEDSKEIMKVLTKVPSMSADVDAEGWGQAQDVLTNVRQIRHIVESKKIVESQKQKLSAAPRQLEPLRHPAVPKSPPVHRNAEYFNDESSSSSSSSSDFSSDSDDCRSRRSSKSDEDTQFFVLHRAPPPAPTPPREDPPSAPSVAISGNSMTFLPDEVNTSDADQVENPNPPSTASPIPPLRLSMPVMASPPSKLSHVIPRLTSSPPASPSLVLPRVQPLKILDSKTVSERFGSMPHFCPMPARGSVDAGVASFFRTALASRDPNLDEIGVTMFSQPVPVIPSSFETVGLCALKAIVYLPPLKALVAIVGEGSPEPSCGFILVDSRNLTVGGRWDSVECLPDVSTEWHVKPSETTRRLGVILSSIKSKMKNVSLILAAGKNRRKVKKDQPAAIDPEEAPTSSHFPVNEAEALKQSARSAAVALSPFFASLESRGGAQIQVPSMANLSLAKRAVRAHEVNVQVSLRSAPRRAIRSSKNKGQGHSSKPTDMNDLLFQPYDDPEIP